MAHSETYAAHAKALLVLGLPLIGSHLAQLAITITDSAMLGWYSVDALAAVTLGSSVFFVIFIVGSGFAFAVLPVVSSAVASGDEVQARRATRMGLWASVLYGLVMMPAMIWSEPILLALGQDPQIVVPTARYMAIVSLGLIPALLVMVLKNYLAALERTQVVLWITLAAAVLNGSLNYVLIFGNFGAPELGLTGAAMASVTMQFATLALVVAYIQRVAPEHALFQRFWRFDRDGFSRIFRLGAPIGLTNLAEAGLFTAAGLLVGRLGALPLAAHGVALQLASITFVVHLGLSQAATVRTGQAVTRGDQAALRDGAQSALALSVAFALATMAVFVLVPDLLVGLFVDPSDPQRPAIIALGATLLLVAALFQLVDGAQVVALGMLRGLQDTRTPMLIAALSYWGLGIPASYVLGFTFGLGAVGVWLGLVIGLSLAAVLMIHRYWRLTRPQILQQI